MKLLYKMIFFFLILHVTILMVNSMNLFKGNELYSDVDTKNFDLTDPNDIVLFLFPAVDGNDNIVFSILVGGFMGLGGILSLVVSLKTGNFGVVVVTLIGASFVPMILNSMKLFKQILLASGSQSQAVIYLAACFSVAVIFLIVITMLETLTHGRGG